MSSILVIGGGGREHAIAWKLAQSEKVSNVAISEKEHDKILAFCQEKVLFWGNDHE